ncbi:hypothetical protein [Niabella soli]|uniref:hypothetical protein n=1 Tax=Niabella soli TaxID=446683 RepID=UPI0002499A9B|nr:hypothetical protein [Niabella soli]
MKARIMYMEYKGAGLAGAARIGRVTFSKTGKSIHYNGKTFQTLNGRGYKANYFDTATGNTIGSPVAKRMAQTGCMVSGCRFILMMMYGRNIGHRSGAGLALKK